MPLGTLPGQSWCGCGEMSLGGKQIIITVPGFSLYKIFFHSKALLWESIILLLPPLACKSYSVAILLHDHCAIYSPPRPDPPFLCHTAHNIGVGNIV